MSHSIEVAASNGQLEAFRKLCLEYAEGLGVDLETQNFSRELAELPGRYAQPGGCILLAMVGEEPAGCVALRPLGDGACEMKRLYVVPRFRALKLGCALVERLLAAARAIGYEVMKLDTIPERMGPAVGLYRKLGFEPAQAYGDNRLSGVAYMELALR